MFYLFLPLVILCVIEWNNKKQADGTSLLKNISKDGQATFRTHLSSCRWAGCRGASWPVPGTWCWCCRTGRRWSWVRWMSQWTSRSTANPRWLRQRCLQALTTACAHLLCSTSLSTAVKTMRCLVGTLCMELTEHILYLRLVIYIFNLY